MSLSDCNSHNPSSSPKHYYTIYTGLQLSNSSILRTAKTWESLQEFELLKQIRLYL